jgi:hypothetical protein
MRKNRRGRGVMAGGMSGRGGMGWRMMRLRAMKGWRYQTGNCCGIVHPFVPRCSRSRKGSEVVPWVVQPSSPFRLTATMMPAVKPTITQKKGA